MEAGKERFGVEVLLRKQFLYPAVRFDGTLRMGSRYVPGFFPERKGNLKTVRIIQPIPRLVNFAGIDALRTSLSAVSDAGSYEI